jgi:cytochrome c oxidase cbb3-type subunit 2
MNRVEVIFLGLLCGLGTSWWGLVWVPQLHLGNQQPVATPGTSQTYPPARPGMAVRGQQVYRANGCFYCHTQQVRARGLGPEFQGTNAIVRYLGADIQRGWGRRFTVALDYLRDQPVMIGRVRVGPDLTNLRVRRPNDGLQTNLFWHLRHLYDPPSAVAGSTMPAHRFLFDMQPVKSGRLARPNEPAWVDESSRLEITPRPEALALADYLFSLEADAPLYEAPLPTPQSAPIPPVAPTNVTGMVSRRSRLTLKTSPVSFNQGAALPEPRSRHTLTGVKHPS